MIDIKQDAVLIRVATGNEGEQIAYHYGKSYDWLIKQYNGEYLNFWANTKKWIRSFGKVKWSKAALFFNDMDIFKRELFREFNGILLPFPSEKERELITIYNRLGLMLAR